MLLLSFGAVSAASAKQPAMRTAAAAAAADADAAELQPYGWHRMGHTILPAGTAAHHALPSSNGQQPNRRLVSAAAATAAATAAVEGNAPAVVATERR